MRRPDFFIVGAPKCGTTALNDYLAQHPEVFMPRVRPPFWTGKELHYFGSDLPFSRARISLEDYLAFFREATDEARVGEASVWYLYSSAAAREIKEFCPTARIIIMLRNPPDMLYSLHSQVVHNRDEDLMALADALRAEPDRKKGLRVPEHNDGVHKLFYRDIVSYTGQVKRYFDAFGHESVHVIIYDDFARDTEKAYRETLRFLGVDDTFEADIRVVNPNKVVRSDWLNRMAKRPPRAVKLAQAVLPRAVRSRIDEILTSWAVENRPRPRMDPALRRRLQDEFVPEVERLSDLLCRDLTFWSRDRQADVDGAGGT